MRRIRFSDVHDVHRSGEVMMKHVAHTGAEEVSRMVDKTSRLSAKEEDDAKSPVDMRR